MVKQLLENLEMMNSIFRIWLIIGGLLLLTSTTAAQTRKTTTEVRTAQRFESLRKSPPQLFAFIKQMPKGADLHNHLSGAIYAESYIQWAAENGLCVNNTTFALALPPCNPGQSAVSAALTNTVLYRQLVDSWSMRNWQVSGQSGHDHFFDAFAKFGPATFNQTGKMIAEAAARAARGNVVYLELMFTPDGSVASQIGQKVGWDGDATATLKRLQDADIASAAAAGIKNIKEAEAEKNRLLKCGTTEADPGCGVETRYLSQVSRGGSLGAVFAQMVNGFELASDPASKVVGLNLVQPEDWLQSMQNFTAQMRMLQFLRSRYPKVHLSLHAGELAPGVVPPEGLSFHIRDSVLVAGAERIGHGVDVMHETDPYDLLKQLATKNVMVEICLSSNDLILGVRGNDHPLRTYLEYGVPIALATDDEGVSRSEISAEFLKAAIDHGLGYLQLKTMARNSLEHAFISGESLWSDAHKFAPVRQCNSDVSVGKLASASCNHYIAASEKARLQWRLEELFAKFENGVPVSSLAARRLRPATR